jgi:hypothetical protein
MRKRRVNCLKEKTKKSRATVKTSINISPVIVYVGDITGFCGLRLNAASDSSRMEGPKWKEYRVYVYGPNVDHRNLR